MLSYRLIVARAEMREQALLPLLLPLSALSLAMLCCVASGMLQCVCTSVSVLLAALAAICRGSLNGN